MSITSLDNSYVASTYGRFPLELAYGKGAKLVDTSGKEYVDMGTGIAVNVFGVCDTIYHLVVLSCILRVVIHIIIILLK